MKYKLKFELVFSPEIEDISIERDIKIKLIESGARMEIESDYPINITNGSQITLGDINFIINGISYQIIGDDYITICKIMEYEYKKRVDEILTRRSIENEYLDYKSKLSKWKSFYIV